MTQETHPPQPEASNGVLRQRVAELEAQVGQESAARQALAQRLERYEALLHHFPNGGMAFFDHDLRYQIVDGAGLRAVGLDGETVRGRTIWEIFPPEVCATLEPQYRATLQGESRSLEVTYANRVFLTHTQPVRNAAGEIIGGALATQEISAQKQAESALRYANERIMTILEQMGEAFFALNCDWVFTYANQHAGKILHRTPEQLVGKNVWEEFPEAVGSTFYHKYHEAMATGEITSFIEYYPPFDIWYEVTATPTSEGLSVYFHDITERKRAEEERLGLQEQVIAAQDSLLRELSTPLIPLTDQVVVMPLIGSLDTYRVQQVMETLLSGIARLQAEVAILDITGVPTVDNQVADALLRAAQAVQLLGARVVLTGIRPDIAQTLVGLGVSLGDLVTRSTLQAGIAYAMGN